MLITKISHKIIVGIYLNVTYKIKFILTIILANQMDFRQVGLFNFLHLDRGNIAAILEQHFNCIFVVFLFKFNWNLLSRIQFIMNKPALVKIMAWRQTGYKPISEAVRVKFACAYMRLRPPWVAIGEHSLYFPRTRDNIPTYLPMLPCIPIHRCIIMYV